MNQINDRTTVNGKNVPLPTADHFKDLSSNGNNSCLSRIDPVAINIKRVIPKARVVK